MITDIFRENLYLELEKNYPVRRMADHFPASRLPSLPASQPSDLSVQWQKEWLGLKEQLRSQLVFLLHTLFDFSSEEASVRIAVQNALEALYEQEEACCRKDPPDAHTCGLCLFRNHWHDPKDLRDSPDSPYSLLTGFHHVENAGFFAKVPQEIATWTRLFLLIERYHRLDALESEKRLDRYRLLRSGSSPFQHIDDLLIRLEQALLRAPEKDIGLLSRETARELEKVLPPSLLGDFPLQPALYILLKCQQFCLSETIEPPEQQHIEHLFATRQLDSLLDLMRIVVRRTLKEHRLPEVGAILDQLQAEGFNIEHQGFRDPYEAQLVPLTDTERFEKSRLALFLPPEKLTGKLSEDLVSSRQMFLDSHRRIVNEVIGDCETYALALIQPLPRAHTIHRLIRFAVSRTLASYPWPLSRTPENLEESVRNLLPENATRHLIRPRKGYEIKSKQELSRLIAAECRYQWKALKHIARTHRIQGLHDYAQFTRYLLFQHLREKCGKEAGAELQNAGLFLSEMAQPEAVVAFAQQWGVDLKQAFPCGPESVWKYLSDTAPFDGISTELAESFDSPESERYQILNDILDRAAPTFYRLVVAYGRQKAEHPRLPATHEDIPCLVHLLAPPFKVLQKKAHERLQHYLDQWGHTLYRNQFPLYILNDSEWEAYLVWEIHRCMTGENGKGNRSGTAYVEKADLNRLLTELQQSVNKIELAPGALTFETLRSTLIKLLRPSEKGPTVSDAQIQEVLSLLPQMDCGACGQSGCREFARSLLRGRAEPKACIHLPPQTLSQIRKRLEAQGAGSQGVSRKARGVKDESISFSPLPPSAFGSHAFPLTPSALRLPAFQNVLSVTTQKTRRLFLERLGNLWDHLSHKPQIFKCPDPETFYTELCRYLGYEAVERLREEERQFLIDHGTQRQQAEWRRLEQTRDWLSLAHQSYRSGPMLRGQDPARIAEETYRNVFFLHQLNSEDRSSVLRFRLESHREEFSQWWNEDLLTMNLPEFSIRDWEDFSKIIKNAYWHQEASLAAGDVLPTLEGALSSVGESDRISDAFLNRWMEQEAKEFDQRRERLRDFRKGHAAGSIGNMDRLRDLLRGLADEILGVNLSVTSSDPEAVISVEDRILADREKLWKRFQQENFVFSCAFSCRREELLSTESEALKSVPGTQHFFLTSWNEPIEKRTALIRALLMTTVRERYQEWAEYRWLQNLLESAPDPVRKPEQRPPLGSFKLLIRQRFREGKDSKAIHEELQEIFQTHPHLHKGLLEDILHALTVRRQYELLKESSDFSLIPEEITAENDEVLNAFPHLKSVLDAQLKRRPVLDRDRLLHYLFLLAKMEGNLDTLTALLREIRETSDIIEAAWLRFTQERILEGPAPKSLPGTTLGIPLLASRLQDKEPVNRGLREGVSRREKRSIAAAVNELLNFVRFHVLLAAGKRSVSKDGIEAVLADIRDTGYDLAGIDEDALRTAVEKEWKRREKSEDRKIWVFTTAVARRLAAQHQELQEAEREFYKIRLDVLKDEAEKETLYQEIASRRSVALGQVKEQMYHQLSDLLEPERIATFQKWIRQIVDQLDRKRLEIHAGWAEGRINRRTLFYLLRQYQKSTREPSREDFQRLLRRHWFEPLAELRSSLRPDREERIHDLDERFRSVLGISLLELETEVSAAAREGLNRWMQDQITRFRENTEQFG